jgi:hypothetical protein
MPKLTAMQYSKLQKKTGSGLVLFRGEGLELPKLRPLVLSETAV